MLPEFNLEKNLPVEDDENLEKKEEWWIKYLKYKLPYIHSQ